MSGIGNFFKALGHFATGCTLNLVSHILDPIVSIPGAIYSAIKAPTNGNGVSGWLRSVGDDQLNRAMSVDEAGQQKDAALLNATLTDGKAQGPSVFGTKKQTISGVIGQNVEAGTLSGTGRVINSILSFIQPNHSVNAIDPNAEPIKDPITK